jgi:phosphatidate cytidylyltransferase
VKERLVTGIFLGVMTFWSIFKLEGISFDVIVTIILLSATWEWIKLSNVKSIFTGILYAIFIVVITYISSFSPIITLGSSLIFWIFVCFLLNTYQQEIKYRTTSCLFIGVFAIVPFFVSICVLHLERQLFLLLVMIVVVSDSSAYFIGKKYGKRKLNIILSPNKTIEGLLGGTILGGISGLAYSLFISISIWQHITIICLSFFIALFSVIGDLLESMLKRQRGIKDSGRILPGHGGILDRIDSLLVSLPIFTLICIVIGLVRN